jgi:hypothetical protein
MITIAFEIGDEPWHYRDAIVITDSQFAAMSADDIEAEKQRRYDAWLKIVKEAENG